MSIRRSENDSNLDATALDLHCRHHLKSRGYVEPHLRHPVVAARRLHRSIHWRYVRQLRSNGKRQARGPISW